MAKIEIVFDKDTGKFVVHYSGVSSHDKEHALTDELIAKLEGAGYDVEVSHHHDAPKIPETPKDEAVFIPKKVRN